MSMQPDRGIVHTDRRSDGLSTITDDTRTLTWQPFQVWQTLGTLYTAMLHEILTLHGRNIRYIYIWTIEISAAATISVSTIATSQTCLVMCHLSEASAVISIGIFVLLRFTDSTQGSQFNPPLPIWLGINDSIWLLLHGNNFWFESQLSHTPGISISDRVSWNQFNSEIVEYSMILRT